MESEVNTKKIEEKWDQVVLQYLKDREYPDTRERGQETGNNGRSLSTHEINVH